MSKRAIGALVAGAFALTFFLSPTPAEAVACNTAGCWAGIVKMVKIDSAGRIWFVVEGSAALNNLVPADGCSVQAIWTGAAEPALYIRPADARATELYALVLTAFTSGQAVGFSPIRDPATGWCALNEIDLRS